MLSPLILANPIVRKILAGLLFLAVIGLVCLGIYMKGRHDGKESAEADIAKERIEWQAKVADAQSKSDAKTEEIVKKYNITIRGYQDQIDRLNKRKQGVKVVEKVVEVYIPQKADFILPNGFIDLHNTSVQGLPLATEAEANAGEPSGKKLSEGGIVIAGNYYKCQATRAQLKALQEVVKEFEKKQEELVK